MRKIRDIYLGPFNLICMLSKVKLYKCIYKQRIKIGQDALQGKTKARGDEGQEKVRITISDSKRECRAAYVQGKVLLKVEVWAGVSGRDGSECH